MGVSLSWCGRSATVLRRSGTEFSKIGKMTVWHRMLNKRAKTKDSSMEHQAGLYYLCESRELLNHFFNLTWSSEKKYQSCLPWEVEKEVRIKLVTQGSPEHRVRHWRSDSCDHCCWKKRGGQEEGPGWDAPVAPLAASQCKNQAASSVFLFSLLFEPH